MGISLSSFFDNIGNDVENWFENLFSGAKTQLENVVGSVTTGFSNLWSGGFAGISESGVEDIKAALKTYCDAIEEQIATFDEEGNISNAYKGEIQTAAREFIRAIKQILQAYVSTMKVSIEDATNAYNNYKAAASDISQDVTADAADVRAQAQSIRID
ncbi:MAG: hypothetical protein IJO63_05660 [Bacilli bacterium]|nr:hypothetical protein [Bacilli bacterium]